MKFIPTPQDFIQGMKFETWMQNGIKGVCPSAKELYPELDRVLPEVPPKERTRIQEGYDRNHQLLD